MGNRGTISYEEMLADLKARHEESAARTAELMAATAELAAAVAAITKIVASGVAGPAPNEDSPSTKETAPPSSEYKSSTAVPLKGDKRFFGLTRIDAAIKYLREVGKKALTHREIWAALEAGGFPATSEFPAKNVQWDLKKRSIAVGDVVLIGRGMWGLREFYSDEEMALFRRAQDGASGRDHALHSAKTKEGMAALRANGVTLGRKVKMTPERIAEAERLIVQGLNSKQVAEALNVVPQTIYVMRRKGKIRDLRESDNVTESRLVN